MILNCHHVSLTVKDPERSVSFYQNILGFQVKETFQTEKSRIVFLTLNDFTLEMICPKEYVQPLAPKGVIAHLAFGTDDVEEEVKRLKEKGVSFTKEPYVALNGSVKVAFFEGPDGEEIELAETLK